MTEPPPAREGHQCYCTGATRDDKRCGHWVDNPDQPICERCEREEHAGDEYYRLIQVNQK